MSETAALRTAAWTMPPEYPSAKNIMFNAADAWEKTIAERDELARQLAQVQRELDNETLRRKSAESGLSLLIKEYDKAMTRLAHYEKVTA